MNKEIPMDATTVKFCLDRKIPISIKFKSDTCPRGYSTRKMTLNIMDMSYWENVSMRSGQGVTLEFYANMQHLFEKV